VGVQTLSSKRCVPARAFGTFCTQLCCVACSRPRRHSLRPVSTHARLEEVAGNPRHPGPRGLALPTRFPPRNVRSCPRTEPAYSLGKRLPASRGGAVSPGPAAFGGQASVGLQPLSHTPSAPQARGT
jgi:hypothetical protein